ncbi:MAG: type II toxin-antitoxin system RelE/ParE family toxin [Clostridiales bacterium]|nr:type II toxin-antitoxin system RelE/ParE family toxin [Clostridiales bacterium]
MSVSRKVRFTPPARAQWLSALAYIRADRPSAARGFKERANHDLSRLIEFPGSGRVIPEFPALGFREVLVDSYRFFYRDKADTVWVVGVWHDAQIPAEPQEPVGG